MELSTLELLQQIKSSGLKITYEKNDLVIKGGRGAKIDDSLLSQLQTQKESILNYLKLLSTQKLIAGIDDKLSENSLKYNGKLYHRLTPTQQYWVDDSIDKDYKESRKSHGEMTLAYEVFGDLNIDILKLSFEKLLERHESLVASFHKIESDYMMRIDDYPVSSYVEYREFPPEQNDLQNDFINFNGHRFKLEERLFLARITQVQKNKYFLSIKVHHVIFDSWSRDLLLRDLIVIYNAFNESTIPKLPVLKYQYKDFLAMTNINRVENSDSNKRYWNHLYPDLPAELIIPEASPIKTSISEKICKVLVLNLSSTAIEKINKASARFSCSRFIIIQSLFKLYIYNRTKQSDIVIGTFVFGRETEGSQHQIGCYAKTVLLRTVIHADDLFQDVVQKVVKANEDMNTNKGFSLLEAIQEKLVHGAGLYGTFWKVNLQYNEANTLITPSSANDDEKMINYNFAIKPLPLQNEPRYIIPIDMQLDFQVSNNNVTLKAEYDSSLYSKKLINVFLNNFIDFIEKTDTSN